MSDRPRPPRARRRSGSDRRANRNARTHCIAVLRLFLLLVLAIARPIRGYRQYESLNRRERRSHDAARQVIAYERDYGGGIYHAIRDLRTKGVRVSIRSVKGYFPKAVTYDWRGRLVASESDPYLRVMKILTTDGLRDVYVRGSRNASIVAGHEAAVRNARTPCSATRSPCMSGVHRTAIACSWDGTGACTHPRRIPM